MKFKKYQNSFLDRGIVPSDSGVMNVSRATAQFGKGFFKPIVLSKFAIKVRRLGSPKIVDSSFGPSQLECFVLDQSKLLVVQKFLNCHANPVFEYHTLYTTLNSETDLKFVDCESLFNWQCNNLTA